MNRQFQAPAPNTLWLSDFTHAPTWQGYVHVAFVSDTFANRFVGWRSSRSPQSQFVLDALEQALYERRLAGDLIHHSGRGSPCVSTRSTEY
uniref:DDE-type integrase/transposase/recombinase n=1 Tax=Ruegeria marisflavi TaxID=2984152 RepID=UPI0037C6F34E